MSNLVPAEPPGTELEWERAGGEFIHLAVPVPLQAQHGPVFKIGTIRESTVGDVRQIAAVQLGVASASGLTLSFAGDLLSADSETLVNAGILNGETVFADFAAELEAEALALGPPAAGQYD